MYLQPKNHEKNSFTKFFRNCFKNKLFNKNINYVLMKKRNFKIILEEYVCLRAR